MTAIRCVCTIFIIVTAALFCVGAEKPKDCTEGCLVAIEGIRPTYSPESHGTIVVRNRTKEQLSVNIAIEGLVDGSWTEVTETISDPKHEFSKILVLSPIKAGASFVIAFNPCATPMTFMQNGSLQISANPCSDSAVNHGVATTLRLRVDVFTKEQMRQMRKPQQVMSQKFKLLPEADSH